MWGWLWLLTGARNNSSRLTLWIVRSNSAKRFLRKRFRSFDRFWDKSFYIKNKVFYPIELNLYLFLERNSDMARK
ncbi:hypothetical protein B1J93_21185 [Leptospira kirschneri serovar Pomona]|uniref:Uncharacterized protein n=1 Tax=Leptospira kirschneri serovar Pomona TaxID=561005 RepID=A0A1T1DGV6_9LEPT|nr:hypothetical protein B1J93_21185 [Leptospira kirschneri serovar Pomona]